MTVRPFRAEDAGAVAALCAGLHAQETTSRDRRDPAPDDFRHHFLGADAAGALLVAEDGDSVVGYCTLHTTYETRFAQRGCYVGDLFVAPAHRRRGHGRALLAASAREARRRGGTFLWWTSLPRNARAHRFYAALGAGREAVRAHALARAAFQALADEAET